MSAPRDDCARQRFSLVDDGAGCVCASNCERVLAVGVLFFQAFGDSENRAV